MLYVYKASAGSGKTYNLTYFYLKICFDHLEDPNYFQHILAMTFTNDATAEMKSRIIDELKALSLQNGKADHAKKLKEECHLSDEEVSKGARSILRAIMQHYTRFSISTIDSFFQKVLRIFTRELDVEGGYEVELDTDKVLDEAMTGFLSDLNVNSKHLKWIEMILEERMNDQKSHDFRNDLLKLGKILFQEDLEHKISERSTADLQVIYGNIFKRLNIIQSQIEENIEQAKTVLNSASLSPDDFKGKSRSFVNKWLDQLAEFDRWNDKFFNKFDKAVDHVEDWYTNSTDASVIGQINSVYPELNALLREVLSKRREVYTLIEIRKYFPSFAFLSTLDQYVQEYCEKEQKILLSRTTFLLKKVIDFQIIPFFYERLGHQYQHILLDEFQDTSGTQWQNLKVLVDHAISQEGNKSLVVGDVKQAIYRWRNGDWRMLHIGLKHEYDKRELYKAVQLEYNWRSLKNVVDFNNRLFDFLPRAGRSYAQKFWDESVPSSYDTEMIEEVFKAHRQSINEKISKSRQGGYVQIDSWLHDTKQKEEHQELQWHLLRQQIRSAIDRGYSKRDICILVRKVSEGTQIAKKLFEWQDLEEQGDRYYSCSSREVLQLSSSLAVQAIIAFYKLVAAPDDKVALAEWHQAMQSLSGEQAKYRHYDRMPDTLKEVLEQSRTQSLWEISDQVIQFAALGQYASQIPFLQHFQDKVLEFMHSEGGHIGEFIEWWEDKGFESAVNLPEGQDAIRIITIHKSKGLEFPIVIMPFVNWAVSALTERGASENWIWSAPKHLLGEQFETFPVNFSKKLANTVFQEEFQDELVQQVIDNINLLYVATTRAERELYLSIPDLKSLDGTNPKSVGDLLVGFSSGTFEFNLRDENLNHYTFELGAMPQVSETEVQENDLISLANYRAAKSIPPLSGKFTKSGLEEKEAEALSRGKALHAIFEHIEQEEDIIKALDQAIENGILSPEERDEVHSMINTLFADREIGSLLNEGGDLLHERELVLQNGQLLRPDRVVLKGKETKVIDFKTGEHYPKNELQLKQYIDALKNMNYQNVQGYLLYLDRAELKIVN